MQRFSFLGSGGLIKKNMSNVACIIGDNHPLNKRISDCSELSTLKRVERLFITKARPYES
jgi:hypothetical protein